MITAIEFEARAKELDYASHLFPVWDLEREKFARSQRGRQINGGKIPSIRRFRNA